MGWFRIAALVFAGIGALLHVGFAYKEMFGWTREFVHEAAPSWLEGLHKDRAEKRILWAKRLAFNVGAYNLMLALGLAWTSGAFYGQPALAGTLAIFFAIWLLAAAAAAFHTQVFLAAKLQGVVGLFLLVTTVAFLKFEP